MKILHKSLEQAVVTKSNPLVSTVYDVKCAKGLAPAPIRACVQSSESDS